MVLAPDSKLIHHESASRGLDKDLSKNKRLMEEVKTMKSRWGDKLDFDPAYSPNLCLDGGGFKLSDNPRINLPWRDSLNNK